MLPSGCLGALFGGRCALRLDGCGWASLSAQGCSRLMLSLPQFGFQLIVHVLRQWIKGLGLLLLVAAGRRGCTGGYDTVDGGAERFFSAAFIPSFHCNILLSVTISECYRFSSSSSALMGRLLSKPYRFFVFLLCTCGSPSCLPSLQCVLFNYKRLA
ncbi:hypothetical protein RIF29_15282 [Crotalaria pallida]|uniref:Uncharacterized protein n=1 Tax=Crotalaria pallida TaxID=3830 RepID=A0AAN9FD86_CROPI